VWLGDIPVATVRTVSGAPVVFYVHTDQLNTPRKVSESAGANANLLRWKWDPQPFGVGNANQNPASLGAFTYNLRFPGQLFDAATNLNYNYFRDYDPATGRYAESDPIGLRGGLNTYAYGFNNPQLYVDPDGRIAFVIPFLPAIGEGLLYLGSAAATAWGICTVSKSRECEKEIQGCIKTCLRAKKDFRQPGVWGGSWWRCMRGCVSWECLDYIDAGKHDDPEK
jgi:RHS repeat-associated protein